MKTIKELWRQAVADGKTEQGYDEWLAEADHGIGAYERIEVTVAICVPMSWDGERYVVQLPMTLTSGGLFSDAEEGAWVPEVEEWIRASDKPLADAMTLATQYVDGILHGIEGAL